MENMIIKNQEAIANMFDVLASICRGSVYIIDFKRKCFQYVGDHDLFLCGYSVDEVMQLGYDFYSQIVHPDDMLLLKKMFNAILIAGSNIDQQNDIHYFSFTFRIKIYPQQRKHPDYLMIYHKLAPVFADGEVQSGVCLITCLETGIEDDEADKYSNKGSGNLSLYYKNSEYFDKYSFKSGRWKTYKIEYLTTNEKIILILAMSGENNKSIANKFCTSPDNLQHILTRLYSKLGVRNMQQAIIHAINHSLIFNHFSSSNVPKQKINKIKINKRNKLTPQVLRRIQKDLDNKQSVRYIAKEAGVSESAIRKAIKLGKLTRK
jgi:DNA-binding CsgD family transcriptional regulator